MSIGCTTPLVKLGLSWNIVLNYRPDLLNINGFMSKRRGSFSTHLYWE